MANARQAARRPAQPDEEGAEELTAADDTAAEEAMKRLEESDARETPPAHESVVSVAARKGDDKEARKAQLRAELAALEEGDAPAHARVVQLGPDHVRVRCITGLKPWADVVVPGSETVCRPLKEDEEVTIHRTLAERMQKNKHVVILGR